MLKPMLFQKDIDPLIIMNHTEYLNKQFVLILNNR